ncbi:Adenosine specific kinase [compost metagenome]
MRLPRVYHDDCIPPPRHLPSLRGQGLGRTRTGLTDHGQNPSPSMAMLIPMPKPIYSQDRPGCRAPSAQETRAMQLLTVNIDKPEEINFIFGQTHFIKSVEDIHEALVAAVPGIKFGMAFCEASGKCLVRWSGTDSAMIELAQRNAQAIGAGHCFIVFLGAGYFPLSVLNSIKLVAEVCRIFCATANPTEVILAETEQGRAVLGVVDGYCARDLEGDDDILWRKDLLRQIGYKL